VCSSDLAGVNIRSMRETDVDDVTNLINEMYRARESMIELIKQTVNIALENGVNQIIAAVDPSNPIATNLSHFRHTEMKLHFFAKSLMQERLPNLGERKLYIDANQM